MFRVMQAAHPDKAVIQKLGGPEAFVLLGFSEAAVRKWMQRGIPWRVRARVRDLARQKGARLPANFLHERAERAA